jgi:GDP-L-fucose synthase
MRVRRSTCARYHALMSVDLADARVLVTGGAGFLGSSVRHVLGERGATDIVTVRSRDHDLTDRAATARLFDEVGPDLVIHLAARVGGIGANMEHPAEIYLANLLMGTHVIEEARRTGVDKTVLVGTICSYPKFTPVPFSEDKLWDGYPEETNASYGIAKKALLVHAQANRLQYGQNCIYVLPANLYGPGDKFNESVSHVIPALVKKFVDAKRTSAGHVTVWGTGAATREFLYVDDAATGIVDAAERYDGAEPVNLGTNEEISIKDLAELIGRLVGFKGELEWDPTRPDGQPRRRVDSSRARELFGFEARMPLEEGLRLTIDYYEAHPDEAEAATF